MHNMFSGCSSLASIDVSGFDTSKATHMDGMFSGCSSLGHLATGAGWTQANVYYQTSRATFPVPMADEAGAKCNEDDVIPDGAHVYTATAPAKKAIDSVKLSRASSAYTGKAQKPAVASVKAGSLALVPSDYAVSYQDSKGKAIKASAIKAAGTYRVVVTGKGNFGGSVSTTFKVTPAKNGVAVAKASVKKSLKASALKKKAASVSLPKATAEFGSAKWKVAAKDKKKVLSLSAGKVKVKKGAKRGTYTIKLKASVAKTANYGAASSKVVTVKVTVK